MRGERGIARCEGIAATEARLAQAASTYPAWKRVSNSNPGTGSNAVSPCIACATTITSPARACPPRLQKRVCQA